eukprot:3442529-Prorocentrum_lima.AAC.1
MTSSLVGSEMCIRDSMKTLRENKGVSHGGPWEEPFDLVWGKVAPWDQSCLLYTSDAADDM